MTEPSWNQGSVALVPIALLRQLPRPVLPHWLGYRCQVALVGSHSPSPVVCLVPRQAWSCPIALQPAPPDPSTAPTPLRMGADRSQKERLPHGLSSLHGNSASSDSQSPAVGSER